jgi:hypothetical protein
MLDDSAPVVTDDDSRARSDVDAPQGVMAGVDMTEIGAVLVFGPGPIAR